MALIGNRFLDALATELVREISRATARRTLSRDSVVAHRGDLVEEVYFPLRGAISEIEEGLDGGSNEVGALGPRDVCGIEALLDVSPCPFLRVVDVDTDVLVVPLAKLLALRDRSIEFHRSIHRYAVTRMQLAGILIGCNARHDVQGRLARWLLTLNDHVLNNDFTLTHETISLMLGVRRETVTRAVAGLIAAHAITASRNVVQIIDRLALETACCSCYPESQILYEQLYA